MKKQSAAEVAITIITSYTPVHFCLLPSKFSMHLNNIHFFKIPVTKIPLF